VAHHRRLLVASLAVAIVVSLIGGWALSRTGDDLPAVDDEIDLGTPTVAQVPGISTNAEVTGDALADITLEDNDGNPVTTRDLVGQPMIINYWYSTCAPCKKELPDFAIVHGELGDQIRFVGVNPLDTPEVNVSFARDRGVTYELLRDPADEFSSIIGVAAAPFTLFVAADGTVVRQAGVLDAAALRAYAQELL
jgi:peroxiredoxin